MSSEADRHASAARRLARVRRRSRLRPCRCDVAANDWPKPPGGRSERTARRAGPRADVDRPDADRRASAFAAAAEQLGFIVRADDPRRHVVACAGAPICASAHIAARALAPLIAAAAAPHLDGSFTIHISGCAKGCAHPAPAALTVVGTPMAARSSPTARRAMLRSRSLPTNELPAAIAEFARERKQRGRPCLSARPICATARRSTSARSPSSAPKPICRAFPPRKPTSRCA